jgi:ferredoxin-NADP reductase
VLNIWRNDVVRRGARVLSTPLGLDGYLGLVNPMWSPQWRGRIVCVLPETHDMSTVRIRTNGRWPAHRPGQYVRLGIELDGRRHWRAYTVTSDPGDALVAVSVKEFGGGVVSGHLVRHAREGDLVHLGEVEGTFCLPDPLPRRVLLISAGSGITPVLGLLRQLDRAGAIEDIVHVACNRAERDFAFGSQLQALAGRRRGYRVHVHLSAERGRITPEGIGRLCPDWRERATFACGPGALLDALEAHWEAAGVAEQLFVERFQPRIGAGVRAGAGGSIRFRLSGIDAQCAGDTPMLVAGLAAGARLPHGCEMGICRTCVGALVEGRVRDLRTGVVNGEPQTMVRTCVSCPDGPVEIDL